MNTEIKDIPLIQNKEAQQFEMHIGEAVALIAYQERGDNYALIHTEVPEALEGKGIASVLVLKTFNFIASEGRKIIPMCAFVKSYLKRHPEWERIVA
jgi:predicted GNAT family acetyltransferase